MHCIPKGSAVHLYQHMVYTLCVSPWRCMREIYDGRRRFPVNMTSSLNVGQTQKENLKRVRNFIYDYLQVFINNTEK